MKGQTFQIPRFESFADVPKTYRELCAVYLPRPIHDEREDAAAAEMMNALAVFTDLNAEQRDYLDALSEFVDAYDRTKELKWPKVKGIDLLKYILAEHDMTGADLSRVLQGSRNLGAMILRGERSLTLGHIRKLAGHFKVSAGLFID